MTDPNPYAPQVFAIVASLTPIATNVSNILGISRNAVLGAIGEEFNSGAGAKSSAINSALDVYVLASVGAIPRPGSSDLVVAAVGTFTQTRGHFCRATNVGSDATWIGQDRNYAVPCLGSYEGGKKKMLMDTSNLNACPQLAPSAILR